MRNAFYLFIFLIVIVGSINRLFNGPAVVKTSSNSECATVKSTSPYQADMDFCLSDFGSEDAWQSKISEFVRQREFSNHDLPDHYTVSVVYYGERKGGSNSSGVGTSSVTEKSYTTAEPSEYEYVENAPATIETEEPKTLKAEASAPIAASGVEESNDDNEIVRSKYVPNLFGEFGETTAFQGKVGKLSANYTLVLHEDQRIDGTYSYPGRKQLYTLKGRMDEGDGSIMLTEYTDGKATATCELVAEGNCYVGQMKNTGGGRAFTMNMCAQE
ncbi:hypothetical protein [Hymenobacter psychrophilus]|uniref:Uncharacterized protein n=1 Tax=Hymenobacter psychrophilus TaxID=651662 RepID=A0A1H3IH03_9BACT|nr:hypothetical protein [Hymenobacter psychrophilus]SDY26922.1 hypothetical protein SAMN04488069_10714 [Hymenobacter psychrophilus]